jgi:hypothetical protein
MRSANRVAPAPRRQQKRPQQKGKAPRNQGGGNSSSADHLVEDDVALDEREELEVLRLENDTLSRRLLQLEDAIGYVQLSTPRRDGDPELAELNQLLEDAQLAKKDALRSSTCGKNALAREVQQLYGLLKQAKSERAHKLALINDLRDKVLQLKRNTSDTRRQCELDREIFARMIKEDRESYTKKLERLEQQLESLSAEKKGTINWAKKKQDDYLKETEQLHGELQKAKQDAISQAVEYNQILSKEIKDLEIEVQAYNQQQRA